MTTAAPPNTARSARRFIKDPALAGQQSAASTGIIMVTVKRMAKGIRSGE